MLLDTQPYLISLISQAFLYILYLASLAHVLRWLLYEEGWTCKRRDKVNWCQLTITLVVFVFTTVDLVLAIADQLLFLSGDVITRQQVTIASISIESATLIITDAILIIRCWFVYQMSWRVVCFPSILWLGNIICVVNWIVNYTLWVFVSEVPYHSRMKIFLQLYYCCNFVTNLYTTSAIVYRVWRVARANGNRQSSILYRICRVVATTGILYTCTSLSQVVTAFYIREHLGVYLLCDAINFAMAGITFNLFLIRVGQLRSELYGMDPDRGTRSASESVWLTTVQFGVSLATNDDTEADANLREKKGDAEDRKRP
ncbi:hypothetical protein M378DRAFT_160476 [Amanita muscaria Koide BX008]|uniref:Transmembrane protein n=1 Tax=Amanita muscaria (strain Koide BX008) TaxID=946122 RepID=A0A0C2XC27_AMAMK|nr:hypothetical protein M378DRAFT_160476 [Amanita muscaria Koide BX008]